MLCHVLFKAKIKVKYTIVKDLWLSMFHNRLRNKYIFIQNFLQNMAMNVLAFSLLICGYYGLRKSSLVISYRTRL